MHYFEGFTCAKDPGAPHTNEDQIVLVPQAVAAVIDGATDISGARFDDVLGADATGGRLAARAVATALQSVAVRPFASPPAVADIVARASEAVAAVYERLAIAPEAVRSGERRFRAAFAAAFLAEETVRLICVGDCGIRINGREVMRREFPADIVLSAARARAWRRLSAKGVPAEAARAAARQMIVTGLGEGREPPEGLSAAEVTEIRAEVLADGAVVAALSGDVERVRHILRAGLEGVRAAPGDFDALVVDGVGDPAPGALTRDLPRGAVETLEIFSDGYPAMGETASVAAWEAALRHADATDPERVGEFASTKGRVGDRFGDDRSIVVLRTATE